MADGQMSGMRLSRKLVDNSFESTNRLDKFLAQLTRQRRGLGLIGLLYTKEAPPCRLCITSVDVHKRTISYCVKDGSGAFHAEGTIPATRFDLDRWMKTLPQPWTAAMEPPVFTGWIHDHLLPHAAALK